METALTPASATIDAGRLLTIERRERFSKLSVLVTHSNYMPAFNLTNQEMLSPRRIYRKLHEYCGGSYADPMETEKRFRGKVAAMFADEIHILMRDWANAGYPASMGERRVAPGMSWIVMLNDTLTESE